MLKSKSKFLICHKVFRVKHKDLIKYVLYDTNEYSILEYNDFLKFLNLEFPKFKNFSLLKEKLEKFDIIVIYSLGKLITIGNLFSEKKIQKESLEILLKEYYNKVEEQLYEKTNSHSVWKTSNIFERIYFKKNTT